MPFTTMSNFDWSSGIFSEEEWQGYLKIRSVALGFVGTRLHTMIVPFLGIMIVPNYGTCYEAS